MTELLDALECAHEAGIIHRDVKPANVMVDAGGHAKLTDFGVARFTEPDGEQSEATRAGTIIGTPSYMSPEQIQGQPLDRRTDIFSAGVLFYQLLTGQKPFEGAQWALAKKIIQDDPVWPSTLVQIPAAIDRVVARALAKAARQALPERAQFRRMRSSSSSRASRRRSPPKSPVAVRLACAQHDQQRGRDRILERGQGQRRSRGPGAVSRAVPHGAFVALARKRVAELRGKKN